MAEVVDIHQSIEGGEKTPMEDMELETDEAVQDSNFSEKSQSNGDHPSSSGDLKREREDGSGSEREDDVSKKQKVDKSVEEERIENLGKDGSKDEEEEKKSDPVSLGPKNFNSSVEMFDYFYKFLHYWPPNLNVNKYEYMTLLDLLKKGHTEADKKLGGGVSTFQIRYHPMWKSRCFFLIRQDESVDDFSFRKCVDHILPLPDNMKANLDAGKALGGSHHKGGGGGRRGRGGHGWGRGDRHRN